MPVLRPLRQFPDIHAEVAFHSKRVYATRCTWSYLAFLSIFAEMGGEEPRENGGYSILFALALGNAMVPLCHDILILRF